MLDLEQIEAVSSDQALFNAARILLEEITTFEDPDSVGLVDCKTTITLGQIKEAINGFVHFSTNRLGDLEDGE